MRIPIETFVERLRRRGVGNVVLNRVRRLNQNGVEEGVYARGWHPTKTIKRYGAIMLRVVSRQDFVARHGVGAYRSLSSEAFVKIGGKRKAVSHEAYCTGRYFADAP